MPGIADLLYLGQPDPMRQLAAALAGQQLQPGQTGPQAAGGPPPPQGDQGPGAPLQLPQGGQDQQQQPVAPGTQPPNAPAQPSGYTSSPDMAQSYQQLASPQNNNIMGLYLQAQQRYQASDQINRGLALIAANHAGNPAMARAIMANAGGGGMSPGGQMSDLMQIYNFQFAQQQRQAFEQALPELAGKFGLDVNMLRMLGPQGVSGLIEKQQQANLPPEEARKYQWFQNQYMQEHANDPGPDGKPIGADQAKKDFEQQNPPFLAMGGMSGMNDPTTRSMTMASVNWDRNPANAGKPKPPYLVDPDKFRVHQTEVSNGSEQFAGLNGSLDSYIGDLSSVATDPNLKDAMGGWVKGAFSALPISPGYATAKRMGSLADSSKVMSGLGGVRANDLKPLGANTDSFTNSSGLTPEDYINDVISPKMKAALTAQSNTWAVAGRANEMPGYLRLYLDPAYKTGGEFDMGGAPKAFTPDKTKKQPDAARIAEFKTDMEHIGPQAALRAMEQDGYDTSSLR